VDAGLYVDSLRAERRHRAVTGGLVTVILGAVSADTGILGTVSARTGIVILARSLAASDHRSSV
jgi:hypothetical protein